MFRRRQRPVLRIDRIREQPGERARKPADSDETPLDWADSVQYAFSSDPDSQLPLGQPQHLAVLLESIGTRADRTAVRFVRVVGDREISVEVLGAAVLDRLFVRWSDTGLDTKSTPPWYFTTSDRTGKMTKVPLGEVPSIFDELDPDGYGRFPSLDVAAVPMEAVVTVDEAATAVKWFLSTWPKDPCDALAWT